MDISAAGVKLQRFFSVKKWTFLALASRNLSTCQRYYGMCNSNSLNTSTVCDVQGPQKSREPVFHIPCASGVAPGHTAAVTGADWYPVDSGLFMSCSIDWTAKLWDTNALTVLTTWKLPARCRAVALSRTATVHMQAAVACEDHHLRLLDLSSGSVSQLFSGVPLPLVRSLWCALYHCNSGTVKAAVTRVHLRVFKFLSTACGKAHARFNDA